MNYHAKRLERVELAPAFEPLPPQDSASKLDALQTLRADRLSLVAAPPPAFSTYINM
jgi:hypothetical protein